jgi:hypothetical protein
MHNYLELVHDGHGEICIDHSLGGQMMEGGHVFSVQSLRRVPSISQEAKLTLILTDGYHQSGPTRGIYLTI